MTFEQRYPQLDILPAKKIRLHENHDPLRTERLIERIKSSGILYNPPLVIPLPGNQGDYMVLDGANRVTAMKEMGLPHVLVQVVNPGSAGLKLETWNHVIWKTDPNKLLAEIKKIGQITLAQFTFSGFTENSLAFLELPGLGQFALSTSSTHLRSHLIYQLVQTYSKLASFDRSMIETIGEVSGYYQQLAGLMIYPTFSIPEVIRFCQEDNLLPAGITRFMVSPRALRLNYPLDRLINSLSLDEKREQLRQFIQVRMEKRGVRIYTETTVLYDE